MSGWAYWLVARTVVVFKIVQQTMLLRVEILHMRTTKLFSKMLLRVEILHMRTTHSLTSNNQSINHSLIHSGTHAITHSLTHSLTHLWRFRL